MKYFPIINRYANKRREIFRLFCAKRKLEHQDKLGYLSILACNYYWFKIKKHFKYARLKIEEEEIKEF